ncbi:hypothetical protein Rhe02_09760 [Rhizocola hellebori]|uniref:Uncharacterized protein n=1 Tax=Rhizocola hellebori TaxID=1392758 RepID=A0A8J3Q379_9ACTN|nr:hypothetical protein [Rhizocola hellebori]GIH02909.1 hypothetical protein Rhe02_09760 [Rhizocola hellebori]
MDDEQFIIAPVTVLHGHTSPDTAYLVPDYPYGQLRCQIRFWLHTANKGQTKQQTRFMYQTTNPRRTAVVWNQPQSSTYAQWMIMYLDHGKRDRQERPFVQYLASGRWVDPALHDRVRLCGAYEQLTEDNRAQLDSMTGLSRKANPDMWAAYEKRKKAVLDYYTEHGRLPQRDEDGLTLGGYIFEQDLRVIAGWVLVTAKPAI